MDELYACYDANADGLLSNDELDAMVSGVLNGSTECPSEVDPLLRFVNKPVTIKGHTGNYLQNGGIWSTGFINANRLISEQMIILPLGTDGLYIVKSYLDGKNLEIGPFGNAIFEDSMEGISSQFYLETDPLNATALYFVSKSNNLVLQCTPFSDAFTINQFRGPWEKLIVESVVLDISAIDIDPRYFD